MFEHVKVLNSCSENVLWFTVKNLLFHELVLFGTIYIPPESSSYSNISIFESYENDIVSLNPENNHKICLIGDFNAHTSNAEDLIIEPWHGISNNVVCATSKASDQPAHTRSLNRAFASCLNII